ncbi:acyl-CoA dehydrogenase family protein [Tianweitania sp.]|uniref:acyl-CoA dehydrogenase family protein n=1 Tax=Tianweitania sp. TaxID=2021634 RepID=UPI00289F2182|nr:acyl-CoA dehydrogenase family protein [Tianweitania sp.]
MIDDPRGFGPKKRALVAAFSDDLRQAVHGLAEDDFRAVLPILVEHGLLQRFVSPVEQGGYRYTGDWKSVLGCLSKIGGIDLSTARLLEGHLNVLQLVALYGSAAQQNFVLETVQNGGMLGVWGADGKEPVRLDGVEGTSAWRIRGSKRYASGAGILRAALVPISQKDGPMQLLLLPVDDPSRVDLSSWHYRGMQRTASGTYSFENLTLGPEAFVGQPDCYRREPWFVGGIWRCAAAQLGAIEAIVRIIARELNDNGRAEHPLQRARIGRAIMQARTARLWIEDAAQRVETTMPDAHTDEIAQTVALSAYSRLVTEEAAMSVIDLAERALGLGSFETSHPVERLTRDLAVYIRQANPDAVLLQHGRVLASGL